MTDPIGTVCIVGMIALLTVAVVAHLWRQGHRAPIVGYHEAAMRPFVLPIRPPPASVVYYLW